MKISIDTKEDSIDDIKRLIDMLRSFVEKNSQSEFTDMFASSSTQETSQSNDSGGLFNLFNDDTPSNTSVVDEPVQPEEKPQERIRIVEY